MLYCLKTSGGKLLEGTASCTEGDCWDVGFRLMCVNIKGFPKDYWHRWDASIKKAQAYGYTIVKCRLVEVK